MMLRYGLLMSLYTNFTCRLIASPCPFWNERKLASVPANSRCAFGLILWA